VEGLTIESRLLQSTPGTAHLTLVRVRSTAVIAMAIGAALLVGCANKPPTPTYGPFTPRNGAGAPVDQSGIPIIGTPWRP
jgi:hypothetical protein